MLTIIINTYLRKIIGNVLIGRKMMKSKSKKTTVYVILAVIVLGIAYTACKDITPEQQRVTADVELKLNK